MKEIKCIGDWGDLSDQNIIKYFESFKNVDFYLLGDNFYPNGVESVKDEQWDKKFKTLFPKQSKKYCCLGNHCYLGNVFAQIEYTFQTNNGNWNLPYFYHDVIDNENSVHSFFIDTQLFATDITVFLSKSCGISNEKLQQYFALVYQLKEKQLTWLDETLSKSKCKWKIICGHYPIRSNGPHQVSSELQLLLEPIIKKHSVDFYVSGHEHNTQAISKNNCICLISGGIYANNHYSINRVHSDTLFYSNDRGFFTFEITRNKLNVYFENVEKQKKEIIFCKLKN